MLAIQDGIIRISTININGTNIQIEKRKCENNSDVEICYIGKGRGDLGCLCDHLFEKSGNRLTIANLKTVFYQTIKHGCLIDDTINDRFNCEILIKKEVYDEKRDQVRKGKQPFIWNR